MAPDTALLMFGLFLAFIAALLWPGRGLISRLRRGRRAELRVGMEDALKHLYKAEYRGTEASLDSLAGALQLGQAAASRLLTELKRTGLARNDRTAVLTDEGRAYALRIIRTHRLWERYLADRTGVAPADWHDQAEEREHFLSEDDVEELSARLGHPRYDPHGDPIPTATGDLPAAVGVPLTHLEAGDQARITHLEDEPRELFDRLVRMGLAPHMPIRILASPPGSVHIEAGGAAVRLDAAEAQNVTVQLVPAGSVSTDDQPTLVALDMGETAEVTGLSPACQGIQRRRLLDLGIVPGTLISAELSAMGGDPRAFVVRGALIALRRDQQAWVRIRASKASMVAS